MTERRENEREKDMTEGKRSKERKCDGVKNYIF